MAVSKLPPNKRPMRRLAHAFQLLYEAVLDGTFDKSRALPERGERKLLLPVRFFLLGVFYKIEPEAKITISQSAKRFDFMLKGNVAVEFAVIRRQINFRKHQSEITKLRHHDGRGAYVILDFSSNPPETKRLKAEFRALYDKAKGANQRPIQIMYYSREGDAPKLRKFALGPKERAEEAGLLV